MADDVQILPFQVANAPNEWTIPPALRILPKVIRAVFDGTAAAGSFHPTLEIVSDSGHTVARSPLSDTVAAGGTADVSWFPSPKPCPPGGACPAWPGADLCGGPSIQTPVAIGAGGGASQVLSLSRTVDCPSLILVVGASQSAPLNAGAVINAVSDSSGNKYFAGASAISQSIGGGGGALELSYGITSVSANNLLNGSTITVTWDGAITVTDSIILVYAIKNVSMAWHDSSDGIAWNGTAGTTDSVIEWGSSDGLQVFNGDGFVGGVFCAIATLPTAFPDFTQARELIGLNTPTMSLSCGIIANLNSGDLFEPGGTMVTANQAVSNYIMMRA